MARDVQRTPDGRHIVVDGRRWRATDPDIPERLGAELRSELMAARRAVGVAMRTSDDAAEAAARRRVADAKIALGERGAPWWEPATPATLRTRSVAAARTLLRHRDASSSICPSDAAKVTEFRRWREVLPEVRASLSELIDRGELVITRGAETVASFEGGPVRIRRGPAFPDAPS
jgi:hypothetical protein